jgi:hypothetical protein
MAAMTVVAVILVRAVLLVYHLVRAQMNDRRVMSKREKASQILNETSLVKNRRRG